MDKPRLICFTGPKTCGKDTMASILFKQNETVPAKYHPLFKKTPFAGGVKGICSDVFGWTPKQMDDPIFKETVLTEWPRCEPRWPMMDIANWMRDKYGPDVWVHALERRIEALEREDPHGAYVITDLRFPNEIDWLKKQNALIIYVLRGEAELALAEAKAKGDPKALNMSEAFYEQMLKGADKVLHNDGSIYEAQEKLLRMVKEKFGDWVFWGTNLEGEV